MSFELPLNSMTITEKIQAMEAIWSDLCGTADFASPDWHKDVLDERRRRIESGDVRFHDWADVKHRLENLGK